VQRIWLPGLSATRAAPRVTESAYLKQIRPELLGGVEAMDRIFTRPDGQGLVTQLALDIPAGRPFRAENRGWLPADAA